MPRYEHDIVTRQKASLLKALAMIKQPLIYHVEPVKQDSLLRRTLDRVPFISSFLHKLDAVGDAVIQIGEHSDGLGDSKSTENMAHGFHIGGVAMASIDFIRVPLIYFAAWMLNEKIPYSLNNNTRWFYSAIVLGLAIVMVAVPALTPIIGLVMAGIGLTAGLFLLGKTLYERYRNATELNQIQLDIQAGELLIKHIQTEASLLEEQIKNEQESVVDYVAKLHTLQERLDEAKTNIETLKHRELMIGHSHKGSAFKIFDRSLMVVLASLTVIGLAISFALPPIGMGIVIGAGLTGLTYLVIRYSAPLIMRLTTWITSQRMATNLPINPTTQPESQPKPENDQVDDSTIDIVSKLTKGDKESIKEILEELTTNVHTEESSMIRVEDEEIKPRSPEPIPPVKIAPIEEDDESEGEGESRSKSENPRV